MWCKEGHAGARWLRCGMQDLAWHALGVGRVWWRVCVYGSVCMAVCVWQRMYFWHERQSALRDTQVLGPPACITLVACTPLPHPSHAPAARAAPMHQRHALLPCTIPPIPPMHQRHALLPCTSSTRCSHAPAARAAPMHHPSHSPSLPSLPCTSGTRCVCALVNPCHATHHDILSMSVPAYLLKCTHGCAIQRIDKGYTKDCIRGQCHIATWVGLGRVRVRWAWA